MKFYIIGSGRRLMEEGVVRTFWRYGVNYMAGALWHKPVTEGHKDIR
jgi:hypothetical protein